MTQSPSAPPVPSGGYAVGDVDRLLDEVAVLVPGLRSVRTDKLEPGPLHTGNPPRAFLEHGDSGHVLKLALRPSGGRSPVEHAMAALRVDSAAQAEELIRLLTELYEINPQAAWSVTSSEVAPLVLSSRAVGRRRLTPETYLGETCQFLREDMPHVERIRVDYQITEAPRGQLGKGRRRAFLRFQTSDGLREFAALDAAGFALHARHQLLQPAGDRMLGLNLERMDHWSAQLGLSPEGLAEYFATMTFLTSVLHLTRIDLR